MPDISKFSEGDWAIFAMLALYHQGTTLQRLGMDLKALSARLQLSLPVNQGELLQRIRAGQKKGLIQYTFGNHVSCTPEGRDQALLHAWKKGWGKVLGQVYRLESGYEFTRGEANAHTFRKALFTESFVDLTRMLNGYAVYHTTPYAVLEDLSAAIPRPLNLEWLSSLPLDIALSVGTALLHRCLLRWESPKPLTTWLHQLYQATSDPNILCLLQESLCHLGRFSECQALAPECPLHLAGIYHFLSGRHQKALDSLDQVWEILRKENRRIKTPFIPGFAGWVHVLTLLEMGNAATAEKIARIFGGKGFRDRTAGLWDGLLDTCILSQGRREGRHQQAPATLSEFPLQTFIHAHVTYWMKPEMFKKAELDSFMAKLISLAAASDMPWFLAQVEALEARRKGLKSREWVLVDLFEATPGWKRTLDSLARLGLEQAENRAPRATKPRRLAWVVDVHRDHGGEAYFELEARDQRQNKDGSWTTGKAIALHKIRSASVGMNFLTPSDQRAIESSSDHPYPDNAVIWRVLHALSGHDYLFIHDRGRLRPLQVRQGDPELRVQSEPTGLRLALFPECVEGEAYHLTEEAPDRFTIYAFNGKHKALGNLLGSKGLLVPESGRDELIKTAAALASMVSIHSDLPLGETAGLLEELSGDPTPELDLRPWGEGLRLTLRSRPALAGPAFPPGSGPSELILDQEGKRCRIRRNLEEERRLASEVLEKCPALTGSGMAWDLEDPADCLELLLQLDPLRDQLRLYWPEGERFKKPIALNASRMSLTLKESGLWFELDGEVHLDEQRVIALRQLLDMLGAAKGDFVPLGEGQWVKLEKHFRERLDMLCALSAGDEKTLKLAPAAALGLEDLTRELHRFKAPKSWQDRSAAIKRAFEGRIAIPRALQAELRTYQEEGFLWLARLGDSGLGACLADDMGLGKTIQGLALLLHRAKGGPALVLAPTSVIGNWASEIRKFAPTLKVQIFGEGDRSTQVKVLGTFDLLLCSYGLLVQEAALLTGVSWHTVILDEAQAIKNADTKRSQTVMALQAQARIALSGTPMENHLGELWNLFRFLNPGLLGSLDHFNRTFAGAPDEDQEKRALGRLRRILKPFLLRRTKQEVLEELPPLTEIVHEVELSDLERDFYEALRRQAIQKLEGSQAPGGQAQIQVLAELMRLRRACCHPRLVDKNWEAGELGASKLEAFAEILEELRDSRHRVLVFSQFVDHLTVIREYLDQNGIAYQYLDGATPPAHRRKAIDAFQGGEGDCFLISLKAGGLGLNLTAADYVIHMDPWWNPAVEDQASSRAHRIGQERPVTVYRLVAKNTIEEKILALHQRKRHLADEILEGSGAASKLSMEELLALLKA